LTGKVCCATTQRQQQTPTEKEMYVNNQLTSVFFNAVFHDYQAFCKRHFGTAEITSELFQVDEPLDEARVIRALVRTAKAANVYFEAMHFHSAGNPHQVAAQLYGTIALQKLAEAAWQPTGALPLEEAHQYFADAFNTFCLAYHAEGQEKPNLAFRLIIGQRQPTSKFLNSGQVTA
jgi:hypothetical protein